MGRDQNTKSVLVFRTSAISSATLSAINGVLSQEAANGMDFSVAGVKSLSFNPNGIKIMSNPNTNAIEVYNRTTGKNEFVVKANGYVYVREINVMPTNIVFPDYVFEKNYTLLPLNEVEAFVIKNKHLPKIPCAKMVEAEGINLAEMQIQQMEKIEELYLYMFELKKENNLLKQRIVLLEQQH